MVLYVVPTPIGNIKDITIRALEILKEVDFILCEDTRCSLKLLNYYGIKNKLISYHKFNEYELMNDIISKISLGNKVALLSDAGMPGISDPGKILINECIQQNIKVDVLPGACGVINSFILTGFDCEKFTFIGFLPTQNKKLRETLEFMININTVLIIYESPHRLLRTLELLSNKFGDKTSIHVGRELTKMFEENFRGTIKEAYEYFSCRKIRGEFILSIDNSELRSFEEFGDDDILREYDLNIKEGFSSKDSIKLVSDGFNIKKNFVYELILKNRK